MDIDMGGYDLKRAEYLFFEGEQLHDVLRAAANWIEGNADVTIRSLPQLETSIDYETGIETVCLSMIFTREKKK